MRLAVALLCLSLLLAVSWRTSDHPSPLPVATLTPPVSDTFAEATYALATRLTVGPYAAELWTDIGPTARPYHGILILLKEGKIALHEEFVVALGALSGSDITGEGDPDLVVEEYSGGAHCCGGTYVLSLGASVRRLRIPCPPRGNASRLGPDPGIASGFHDLDGDGVFEFVTWDDSFQYEFGSYAESPAVPVVLRYDSVLGYIPANSFLSDVYEQAVTAQLARIEAWPEGSVKPEIAASAVTQLVLLYLYTGRPTEAWEALYRHYSFPNVEDLRQRIEEVVYGSPCFQREVVPPD